MCAHGKPHRCCTHGYICGECLRGDVGHASQPCVGVATMCNASSVSPHACCAPQSAAVPKTTQLKNLIKSDQLSFIMEAHNGLTAKIVEEVGFKVS